MERMNTDQEVMTEPECTTPPHARGRVEAMTANIRTKIIPRDDAWRYDGQERLMMQRAGYNFE